MDETQFHVTADATLTRFHDQLEPAYEAGGLDELELHGGILTVQTQTGKTFLVTKHAPSMQLWLASPLSGGLHFVFDAASGGWKLADGRSLSDVLQHELLSQNITVTL